MFLKYNIDFLFKNYKFDQICVQILKCLSKQTLQLKCSDQSVFLLLFFLRISKYLPVAQFEMKSDFEISNS